MLGLRPVPVSFRRSLGWSDDGVVVTSELSLNGKAKAESMAIGDEFDVRYVPQSRYFQRKDLDASARVLNVEEIRRLNEEGRFSSQELVKVEHGVPTPADLEDSHEAG